MKRYIAVLEIDDDDEIIDASVSYVYRSNGTNYSTTESVEFKEESEDAKNKTYEDGLNEAWELARYISCTPKEGGKSINWVEDVFGCGNRRYVLRRHSASEVIAKIEECENRIKVGDEVIDINSMSEKKSVVVRVSGSVITIMEGDGTVSRWEKEDFKKTGRHFSQIEEVLKQMQEGNE